jgi:hypothetical protein
VNGSHGVTRPGGSALNAGQVGGFRVAEFVANRYAEWTIDREAAAEAARVAAGEAAGWLAAAAADARSWQAERDELQARMSRAGAHIREPGRLRAAVEEARAQWRRVAGDGCACGDPAERAAAFQTRALCFAHVVYLEAVLFAVESGVGSRGSAMLLDPKGTEAHESLSEEWRFAPEDAAFREEVLETSVAADGRTAHRYVPRRPIPESDAWFETAWAAFQRGEIYETKEVISDQ